MLINTPTLALGSVSSFVTCWQVSQESRTPATNSGGRKEERAEIPSSVQPCLLLSCKLLW